jgi:ligand-binding sensor domain-containing protein
MGTSLGVSRLAADGTWLEPLPTESGLSTQAVNDLAVDPKGRVWVALTGDVIRWDGGQWRQVVTPYDSASTWNTLSIMAADDGVVWIGAEAGVAGLDGTWENFIIEAGGSPDEAAVNLVEGVWVEGETIWAGNSRGVSRSEDGGATWHTATTADGLGNDKVTALWREGGVLWAGTVDAGVSRSMDGGITWQTSRIGEGYWDNVVQDLWSDGRTLWAGTAGGVGRSDDGGVTWRML